MKLDYIYKLNDIYKNLGFRIRRRELEKIKESGLKITWKEFLYLIEVGKREGSKIGDLTKYVWTSKATMSNVMKHIEKKGYVRYEVDKIDTRVRRLYLTSEGKKVFKLYQDIHEEIYEKFSQNFTTEEIKTLIKMYEKVKND